MKRICFLLILVFLVTTCQRAYDNTKLPYKFLPTETSSVIKINELNAFLNGIDNNEILSHLYQKEIKRATISLKNLNARTPLYISFLNKTEPGYLILTQNDSLLFKLDTLANHISETLVKFQIEKTQIDSSIVYHKTIGNVFAGSNNIEILKKLSIENENKELSKLLETVDDQSIASLVFKSNSLNYSKLLFSEIEDDAYNPNFAILDLDYSDKHLQYNGIVSSKDSITSKLDIFKHSIPQKIKTPEFAPSKVNSLLSVTYDDFSIFNKNRSELNEQPLDSTQTFLDFSTEIALTDNAIILHALDTDLVLESIEAKSNIETFRSIAIYKYGNPNFFESRLQPLVKFKNANYFSIYENFVVFSNSIETLKSILSDVLNKNTLSNSDAFKNLSANLSDEASMFIYKDAAGLSKVLGKNVTGYNANVVQFIYEDNYAHVNGIIQKFKKRAVSNSISEAFTTPLDAELISAPQTLKNHITKAHDIAVQDVNNVLHLISNSGRVLWKKQLQGQILGRIEQMDLFKNGRLQLVFATSKRLYVLDRNGKNASNFPLKFDDVITQPLSVFDYDKRRNYRLLVTQGKNLLMYDAKGKSVSGFKYNSDSNITSQPKHFRIASKDYIVFSAGENLKILNRKGNIRINVKNKIRFSENPLFSYQNKFTTTNTLGQLIQVDVRGKLSKKTLNLTDKHHIETTSKTLVTMTENKLKIKSRTIDLDYGDYTAPRIFYLNDKIYVTTTDLQAKKVYLFNSQAKSIPHFPVFGTSSAELQELDKDSGLELITQSDDKTILVYKLN